MSFVELSYYLHATEATHKQKLKIVFESFNADIHLQDLAKALWQQNGIKPEIVHIFVPPNQARLNALIVCTTNAVFRNTFHSNEKPLEVKISPLGRFLFPEGFETSLKYDLKINKNPCPISLHICEDADSNTAETSPFLEYSIHDFQKQGQQAQYNKISFDFFDGFDMKTSDFQTMMQQQQGFFCGTMKITIRHVNVSPMMLLQHAIETRRTGTWVHGSLKRLKLVLIGCTVDLGWLRRLLQVPLDTKHWIRFNPTNQSLCINAKRAQNAPQMISNFIQEFAPVKYRCELELSHGLSFSCTCQQFNCSINPHLVQNATVLKSSLSLIPEELDIHFSFHGSIQANERTSTQIANRNKGIAEGAFADRKFLDLEFSDFTLPPDDFFNAICGTRNRKLTLRISGRTYTSKEEMKADIIRLQSHGKRLADLVAKKMLPGDDVFSSLEAFDVFGTTVLYQSPQKSFPIINSKDRWFLDYYLLLHKLGDPQRRSLGDPERRSSDWTCKALARNDSSNDAANLSIRFHYLSQYLDTLPCFVLRGHDRRVRQRLF